jgi:cardiolipin synthase
LRELRYPHPQMQGPIWTVPNQITLLRLGFLPFFLILIFYEEYRWALLVLVAAGVSDAADGLLARKLNQRSPLGAYLDPIADKLLLSTMFLVLSILHKIPWKFTVLVFSRDITILLASAVLYAIAGLRDFRPSIFGKANTFAQVAAVFFVLLFEINKSRWVAIARLSFLRATFAFTIISAMHYVLVVEQRLRATHQVSTSPSANNRI